MKDRIGRWLCFGVFFSVFPWLLVMIGYHSLGRPLEGKDYIPDLLLVTFAVAVNALSSVCGRHTKNETIENFCLFISGVSMLVCCGFYFLLIGYAINMSETLNKLELITTGQAELAAEVVSDIAESLKDLADNPQWNTFKYISVFLGVSCALLGVGVERKQYLKEKQEKQLDYVHITNELREFLQGARKTLPSDDYQKLLENITAIMKEERQDYFQITNELRRYLKARKTNPNVSSDNYEKTLKRIKAIMNEKSK